MNISPIIGFSEPVSSWIHLIASFVFLGLGVLLWRRSYPNPLRLFSVAIYTVTLVFLFSMSGVYHLLEPGGVARSVLQRLDHAGIWALIAGTFTPIHLILFRRFWRWGVIAVIWTVSITGLVLEVVFFKDFPEWLALTLYLSLGWVGVATTRRFHLDFNHPSYRYLIYGGFFYSIGAVMEFMRWPVWIDGVIGPHEIFHVFVVMAAYAHWKFIFNWCHYPIVDHLTFDVQVYPSGEMVANAIGDNLCVMSFDKNDLKKKIEKKLKSLYEPNICKSYRLKYFEEDVVRFESKL